jgi:hypothetical protein
MDIGVHDVFQSFKSLHMVSFVGGAVVWLPYFFFLTIFMQKACQLSKNLDSSYEISMFSVKSEL